MTLWDAGDPLIEGPESAEEGDNEGASKTWRVGELGAAITASLASSFPGEVWVHGEVRSARAPNRNGHQYFDLVEPGAGPGDPPVAKISVTLFSGRRRRIISELADSGTVLQLEDGIEVRIRGALDWWVAGGKLNFVMSGIDPVFTLGQLDAQRRALLSELGAQGLLDRNAQLTVPPLPLRVGLVTSAGSAAHADFVHELESGRYVFDVLLADARVQGVDAPPTLVAAIRKLAALGPDVIAVVRGGGSRTDLVAFDHGDVAKAIATSPVPVFTGIGHEIDRSVADEVAHSAFKTPTAVADHLVELVGATEAALSTRADRLGRVTRQRLTEAERQLSERLHRVARAAGVADTRAATHLDAVAIRLATAAQRALRDADRAQDLRRRQLISSAPRQLVRHQHHLDTVRARLDASDPARVLARGWSLTRTADGALIRTVSEVGPGDVVVTTVSDGIISSTITATTNDEEQP